MLATATLLAAVVTWAPPSGRPPAFPLERVEPRVYDIKFEVGLTTAWQYDITQQKDYLLRDAPIVMPVVFRGAYHSVDNTSLVPDLLLLNRRDEGVRQRFRVDEGYPFHTHMAVITVEQFQGKSLRWSLRYRVQSWSSKLVSEEAAAAATWPREWPEEVRDGLQRQMFIEPEHPIFAETLERISGGQLRMVPPYLAAKDIVRHCVENIRISGNGVSRSAVRSLRGLELRGSVTTALEGLGGPHDLVCVSVAMLRAAGIPARAIIGIEEGPPPRERNDFVSWAEFYLPEIGWVPFDPMEMRGKIRHRDVRQPWPEFGTMEDLNQRIPLAYHFVPPAAVETPQNPAVWGWDPRPKGDPSSDQSIHLTIISRGRGREAE